MVLLALICLLIAAMIASVWYKRAFTSHESVSTKPLEEGSGTHSLPDVTRTLLSQLDSPVEIRFYSSLSQSRVPPSLQAFSDRVDGLLSAFSQEANGKILVTHHDATSSSDVRAQALSDGIQPWTVDQGDPSYLGLAIIHGTDKVSIPRIAEEWEGALEYDLTRAIARVTKAGSQNQPVVDASRLDAAATRQLAEIIPDLANVSADEGSRILHEAALAEFQSAVKDMQAQVKQAQQRLLEAQRGESEADQRNAMEQLQQVRQEQTQKLKSLARRLDEQLAALNRVKGIPVPPPVEGSNRRRTTPTR